MVLCEVCVCVYVCTCAMSCPVMSCPAHVMSCSWCNTVLHMYRFRCVCCGWEPWRSSCTLSMPVTMLIHSSHEFKTLIKSIRTCMCVPLSYLYHVRASLLTIKSKYCVFRIAVYKMFQQLVVAFINKWQVYPSICVSLCPHDPSKPVWTCTYCIIYRSVSFND